MADPAKQEKKTEPEAPPAAAAPPVQDFEQRMESRLQAFEDRIFGRVAQFVNPGQQRAPEPGLPEPPSDEEIEEALESGDSKKAAKLLARQQKAHLAAMEKRFGDQLGQATSLVADRLTKLNRHSAKDLEYYGRFGKEIDTLIAERGLDGTDPEVLRTVHDLVAAKHMKEIVQEEVEKARRSALEEGEEAAFKEIGGRRRRKPSSSELEEYREVPVKEDDREELEFLGFDGDENAFARSRGFKDPTGKGKDWDYMHHVGRQRERGQRDGRGMNSFLDFVRNQKQHFGRKASEQLQNE